MSGNLIIGLGLFLILAGTALTMWGQSVNSKKDVDKLLHQNETQSALIQALQKETQTLKNIGKSQLDATFYTEALNHEVRTVYVRIKLNKKYKYNDLPKLFFAVDFNPLDNKKYQFRKLFENTSVFTHTKNGIRTALLSYTLYELDFKKGAVIKELYRSAPIAELSEFLIPIYLPKNSNGIKVKDFHDEPITFQISNSLLNISDSIEFIVNGWILLDDDLSNIKRGNTPLPWEALRKSKEPFSNKRLRINIYEEIPNKDISLYSKDISNSESEDLIFYFESQDNP